MDAATLRKFGDDTALMTATNQRVPGAAEVSPAAVCRPRTESVLSSR